MEQIFGSSPKGFKKESFLKSLKTVQKVSFLKTLNFECRLRTSPKFFFDVMEKKIYFFEQTGRKLGRFVGKN